MKLNSKRLRGYLTFFALLVAGNNSAFAYCEEYYDKYWPGNPNNARSIESENNTIDHGRYDDGREFTGEDYIQLLEDTKKHHEGIADAEYSDEKSRALSACYAKAYGNRLTQLKAEGKSKKKKSPSFSLTTKPTPDGGCLYVIKNHENYALMCHIVTLANVAVYVSAKGENSSGSPYGQCPNVKVTCARSKVQ